MLWTTAKETLPNLGSSSRVVTSFRKGHKFAAEGAYWGLPIIALQAATAPPGELIPTGLSTVISLAIQPAISGAVSAGLTVSLGMPPMAAAIASTLLIGYAASQVEHSMIRGFKELSHEGTNATKVRFGSGYMDTQNSQQRRQRAVLEMTNTAPAGRGWLGQEALFLHK
jgi:hypothetical protein